MERRSRTWILAERSRIRNQEIGFIFQSFNLIGDLTVYENVELPLTYRQKMSAPIQRNESWTHWSAVGMAHRIRHILRSCREASSNRGFGRALSGKPSIMLADEPRQSRFAQWWKR